jgi:hypothetical protein
MWPDGPFKVGVSYSFKSYCFNEEIHFLNSLLFINVKKELERKVHFIIINHKYSGFGI